MLSEVKSVVVLVRKVELYPVHSPGEGILHPNFAGQLLALSRIQNSDHKVAN